MKKQENKQSVRINKSKNVTIGDLNINAKKGTDNSPAEGAPDDEFTREIERLIAKGKTRQALERLLRHYAPETEAYESTVLLLNRLNRVDTEQRLGIIDTEQHAITQNQLSHAALKLVRVT